MTYEKDPVVATLAERASAQVRNGVKELHDGNVLASLVYLAAAQATLLSLQSLLDGTAQKPMRRMALVQKPRDEDADSDWFDRKANDTPDGAA